MDDIKRAMVHGSVVASYTVEDFSVGKLKTLTPDHIQGRYLDFKRFTNFEPTCPWSDSCTHLAPCEGGTANH